MRDRITDIPQILVTDGSMENINWPAIPAWTDDGLAADDEDIESLGVTPTGFWYDNI